MSAIYAFAKASLLGAAPAINLTTDTIKAALVTGAYTPNTAAGGDQYWSVVGANYAGTPQQITSPSVTGGVFNGAGVTYASVASGPAVSQIVLYKDTGVAATSPLVAVLTAGSGLPVTPNGSNISIAWDTGANKIFAL
jgi:hypothetical protein